jgi:anti-anti-sigma regulatory factor
VLKITQGARNGDKMMLKFEGEILLPWVSTVRDACGSQARGTRQLSLDLAGVTYVDDAGAQLLRDLLRDGIELAACSSFLTALLHLDD